MSLQARSLKVNYLYLLKRKKKALLSGSVHVFYAMLVNCDILNRKRGEGTLYSAAMLLSEGLFLDTGLAFIGCLKKAISSEDWTRSCVNLLPVSKALVMLPPQAG